jgi:hypothetical protein
MQAHGVGKKRIRNIGLFSPSTLPLNFISLAPSLLTVTDAIW